MLDTPAPDFDACSTMGSIRLSDMRGRWICLFSHPADFTPVCASEFMGFERLRPEFEAEQCQLIGISVDSIHTHYVSKIEPDVDAAAASLMSLSPLPLVDLLPIA